MKININNNLIDFNQYLSIKSLISSYTNDYNDNNYYVMYNGKILESNNSLQYYNIDEYTNLQLNKRVCGGDAKWIVYVLYAITGLFVLYSFWPLTNGAIPFEVKMIQILITSSLHDIFNIYFKDHPIILKRLKYLINFLLFILFILFIYILFAIPLTLLTITVKNKDITKNPKNICSCLKYSYLMSLILTFLYIMLYFIHYQSVSSDMKQNVTIFVKFFGKKILNLFKIVLFPIILIVAIMTGHFSWIPFIGNDTEDDYSPYINQQFSRLNGLERNMYSTIQMIRAMGCGNKRLTLNMFEKALKDPDILSSHTNVTEACCSPENMSNIAYQIEGYLSDSAYRDELKLKGLLEPALYIHNMLKEETYFGMILGFDYDEFIKKSLKLLVCNIITFSNKSINIIAEIGSPAIIKYTILAGLLTGTGFLWYVYIIIIVALILLGVFNVY